jgi:hypothetical protein
MYLELDKDVEEVTKAKVVYLKVVKRWYLDLAKNTSVYMTAYIMKNIKEENIWTQVS